MIHHCMKKNISILTSKQGLSQCRLQRITGSFYKSSCVKKFFTLHKVTGRKVGFSCCDHSYVMLQTPIQTHLTLTITHIQVQYIDFSSILCNQVSGKRAIKCKLQIFINLWKDTNAKLTYCRMLNVSYANIIFMVSSIFATLRSPAKLA